jgi:hypothetical protein
MPSAEGIDRNSSRETLLRRLRAPDLSILGDSIRALPPTLWQQGMLFSGAPDNDLRHLTGTFPASLHGGDSTHPIFILQTMPSGHLVCPCSSKGQATRFRYIRQGCLLEMNPTQTDIDSYLIESCQFTLPLDQRFSQRLHFRGLVPPDCIIDLRSTS